MQFRAGTPCTEPTGREWQMPKIMRALRYKRKKDEPSARHDCVLAQLGGVDNPGNVKKLPHVFPTSDEVVHIEHDVRLYIVFVCED
eukprot:3202688-Amphidinium_carterae.1